MCRALNLNEKLIRSANLADLNSIVKRSRNQTLDSSFYEKLFKIELPKIDEVVNLLAKKIIETGCMSRFKIDSNVISKDGPLYFIADIGANHDGEINRAFKLIELAKESGAHATKFQNFTAQRLLAKKDLII